MCNLVMLLRVQSLGAEGLSVHCQQAAAMALNIFALSIFTACVMELFLWFCLCVCTFLTHWVHAVDFNLALAWKT